MAISLTWNLFSFPPYIFSSPADRSRFLWNSWKENILIPTSPVTKLQNPYSSFILPDCIISPMNIHMRSALFFNPLIPLSIWRELAIIEILKKPFVLLYKENTICIEWETLKHKQEGKKGQSLMTIYVRLRSPHQKSKNNKWLIGHSTETERSSIHTDVSRAHCEKSYGMSGGSSNTTWDVVRSF